MDSWHSSPSTQKKDHKIGEALEDFRRMFKEKEGTCLCSEGAALADSPSSSTKPTWTKNNILRYFNNA